MVRMVFRVVIVVSGALAFPEELRNASHVASLFASLEAPLHVPSRAAPWAAPSVGVKAELGSQRPP